MQEKFDIDISVVVPCYRSSGTLLELSKRLAIVLDSLMLRWEMIFIDDNSDDDTWPILQEIYELYRGRVQIVRLMRNFGQHNALMCGFHKVNGQYTVTIDDDLQNPPEEITKLYTAIESTQLDLVYADITGGKKHHPLRNLGSLMRDAIARIVMRHSVPISSFRIIRYEVIKAAIRYNHHFSCVDGIFVWSTQRIGSVPIEHCPRLLGASGYSFGKLMNLAINMLTNFSLIPLQFASLIGVSLAGVGFLMALYYMWLFFIGGITVSGFASIIVSVLVLGGVQLLATGMMGEYLGRIHLNVNGKPQFVIREQR
jgi:undecaprenyl-phosphate 4-deoxy-4-formamido-L-arabinose transferase